MRLVKGAKGDIAGARTHGSDPAREAGRAETPGPRHGKPAEMASALQAQATGALEDLRDLARGIYPPLLADKGLPAALEAQARKAAVPTAVSADGVGRYDQAVEAAVYFCALEALNNVAKHADPDTAEITLGRRNGTLSFRVRDDRRGFDPSQAFGGTGLQGMADRLDAIGGRLMVSSAPGATVVEGTIRVRVDR